MHRLLVSSLVCPFVGARAHLDIPSCHRFSDAEANENVGVELAEVLGKVVGSACLPRFLFEQVVVYSHDVSLTVRSCHMVKKGDLLLGECRVSCVHPSDPMQYLLLLM